MRFRKKPVVIDSMQLRGDTWEEMRVFVDAGRLQDGKPEALFGDDGIVIELAIPTLEGVMIASLGDWIIRGVQGELYPCKPGIFEQTYEAVDGE